MNIRELTKIIFFISLGCLLIQKEKALSHNLTELAIHYEDELNLDKFTIKNNIIISNNNSLFLSDKSVDFSFTSFDDYSLIASAENFNPSLTNPEEIKILEPNNDNLEPIHIDEFDNLTDSSFQIESINTRFFVDTDNYGQRNQFIESTVNFNTSSDDQIELKTGVNTFTKPDIDKVYNIPLIFGWKTKINDVTLKINGGFEIFDRLPVAPSFSVVAEAPLLVRIKPDGDLQSLFVLINALEYQPYKFNAQTLDNQIKTFRFRPSFYWLIAPDISLFSFSQFGSLNDGNKDYQSFTRLEKNFGEFSLSTNLFTWSFHQNFEQKSGYFSPPDFLVYNLELAWQKDITDFLNCRLVASLGQQRLNGEFSNAQVYEGFCDGKISENISLGLGYRVSNIQTIETGESSYLNEQFTGRLNIKF